MQRKLIPTREGAKGSWAAPGAPEPKILFGGSVTGEVAPGIIQAKGVDGLLIGGASLRSDQLLRIARSVRSRGGAR